ncbi:hypothetical protein LZG00_13515 [Rhodobacteraceae bacterium LMO-12]|nr:hypothetical protein [Rhodobacteraceae bacterium LMO-JJ12]
MKPTARHDCPYGLSPLGCRKIETIGRPSCSQAPSALKSIRSGTLSGPAAFFSYSDNYLTGDHRQSQNDGGRTVGFLSRVDAVHQNRVCTDASRTAPMTEETTRDVTSAAPKEQLEDAREVRKSCGFRDIPIISSGVDPPSILSARNALQNLWQVIQQEEYLWSNHLVNLGCR